MASQQFHNSVDSNKMDIQDFPLVSVNIITYNSGEYIIDTLESVKNQTYNYIELIISDDCSTDDTVAKCMDWLNENPNRFVRTEMLTVTENTGVTANCNRSLDVSSGEWIMFVAGDDLLFDTCLYNFINHIRQNMQCEIIASNVVFFTDDLNSKANFNTQLDRLGFFQFNASAKEQFRILTYSNPILAPSVFMSRKILITLGGFDERFVDMEDYPFWLKATMNGYRIDLMNKLTAGYRLRSNSISGYSKSTIFNKAYKDIYIFRKQFTFRYLNVMRKFNLMYTYYIRHIFDKLNINKIEYKSLYIFLLRLNVFNYFK